MRSTADLTRDPRLDRVAKPLNRENRRLFCALVSVQGGSRHIQDIAGLDADKLPPFALAEVLQARCPFAPRIPHHRSERMFLPQSDSTLLVHIQQVNFVWSVAVGAVGR